MYIIIGILIISSVLVLSYLFFDSVKKKEEAVVARRAQEFNSQLEMLEIKNLRFKIVYAGGDTNSEVSVADAIENIVMSEDVRIRNYE